ncbi:MAG: hypothetical protein M1504_03335 [Candidatus Marsarchaeota archaeon]|nr:hypothetical protein [Candidatus Marsarchaeota archaeon]
MTYAGSAVNTPIGIGPNPNPLNCSGGPCINRGPEINSSSGGTGGGGSGGGGSGGGGSGSGGSSSGGAGTTSGSINVNYGAAPTACSYTTLTTGDEYFALVNGKQFSILLKYLNNNYAVVLINNQPLNISINQSFEQWGTSTLYLQLVGISYASVPAATFDVCTSSFAVSQPASKLSFANATPTPAPPPNHPASANTNATLTKSTTSSSTALPFGLDQTWPPIGGGLLTLAAVGRLRRRMVRGRKQHKAENPGMIRTFEELGVLDTLAFLALVIFYFSNYTILSAAVAFSLGIMIAYTLDHIRSRNAFEEYQYVRKDGMRRYMEELGLGEAIILIVAVLFFVSNMLLLGIITIFFFGIAIAYFVDRLRDVKLLNTVQQGVNVVVSGGEPILSKYFAPATTQQTQKQQPKAQPQESDEPIPASASNSNVTEPQAGMEDANMEQQEQDQQKKDISMGPEDTANAKQKKKAKGRKDKEKKN